MLIVKRTVMLTVAGIAHGFSTGSGDKIPLSVEMCDFCRWFRVESNIAIKIYMSHDVLLTNEMHNVIDRNSLFKILTAI